ncbi:hypothetical protein PIB30_018518 [Stylosanthes scabra]|uniref:Uncharacterized protein n=1 Tax=Stylosanthes scabra TaxID=79078 RepID=A0ABU6Y6Y7_9FABA|nr:hypothetical protein [Stylosanthes scabra]
MTLLNTHMLFMHSMSFLGAGGDLEFEQSYGGRELMKNSFKYELFTLLDARIPHSWSSKVFLQPLTQSRMSFFQQSNMGDFKRLDVVPLLSTHTLISFCRNV